jgi:hypothetical protein
MDATSGRDVAYTLPNFLAMYEKLTLYHSKVTRDGRIKESGKVSQPPPGEFSEQR